MQRSKRVILEVYPHPALIELFGLASILKYKKGSNGARAAGLHELQRLIGSLRTAEPALRDSALLAHLLALAPDTLRGTSRKELEDALDAVVCAYIGFHFWYWGESGSTIFGDETTGYIVVPQSTGARSSRASG